MLAGTHLFKGRHGLTVLGHIHPVQEHGQHARLIAVHDEFLVAHGEATLKPASGVQHKVDAGECGSL